MPHKEPQVGIAERIRGLIATSGASPREIAEQIGMDPARLSAALAGQRRFSSWDLALIGEHFGATIDWLLTGHRPRWWTRLWQTAMRLGWRVRRLWWRVCEYRISR